jgi:hypothetical protein
MKLINITLNSTPTAPTTMKYKVEYNLNGNWYLCHTGKFWVNTGQSTVQLDLDDILMNYQFQGKQSIKPVANAIYNAYMPSVADTGVLNECWCNSIRVVSLDNPMSFPTVTKSFFFLPTQIFGYEGIDLSVGGYIPAQYHYLLPTLPTNKPDGFVFSTLFYVNIGGQTIDVKKNTTTTDTIATTANTAYHVKLDYTAGEKCTFYVGGIPVAKTEDSCNTDCYLVWVQRDGALNCQPFTKSSKFSKTFNNKTAVDVRNAEWKISSTETGVWKLKSRTLTEDEYKDMGQMFESPYILLLEMQTGKMWYVNITSKNYEEKKRTRTDRKPIFMEVEVTSCDHIRV